MKKSYYVKNSSTIPFLFHSKNTAHPTRKEPMRLSCRLLFRSCRGRKGALLPLAGSMNFSCSSQDTIEGPARILCRLVRLFRRSGLSLKWPPHMLYFDEHSKFPTHPSPPSPPLPIRMHLAVSRPLPSSSLFWGVSDETPGFIPFEGEVSPMKPAPVTAETARPQRAEGTGFFRRSFQRSPWHSDCLNENVLMSPPS